MSDGQDILVIGGGIAGVSAAAALSADRKVTVLEMEDGIGRHSTGRSAAIFVRNLGNEIVRALTDFSRPLFDALHAASEDPLLSPRGRMMVAAEDEVAALRAYLEGAVGIDELTREEAVELWPLLRPERIALAVIERGALDIDVDLLLQRYARQLRAAGGRVVPKATVAALRRQGGLWRVETGHGVFEAPIVVNAAGAWADEVAALAGLKRLGLQPMRRSAAIVPAPAELDVMALPMIAGGAGGWYAKPMGGKLMVSPQDEDPTEPHDAWADDMVLAEGIYRFEQAVAFDVTRVEHSWAGLRTFAPDRAPVIGFSPKAEGFFWLAGQGGFGVQTAPGAARFAADLMCGRSSALKADVANAISPTRF